ncbi:hypothetical protein BO83DRAFT_382843 [Aspergillus eucalypticola CBS 122712]|uniref:Uncharacterized protein n=1 Tax=Aspergillus eucalypticola (strain CBS 122712 / IBT 29274) TaxID=1448314 RepID=A0A317URN1_ASPEC|nr:uncharacterized protein BO83DRAFT_382843 [Aspergillus eucalypticola CBS 122712]PWY63237.1 hypothetical protein BO83DRAFT_382843 [Aspergillus eucalypticola CBS 122712]
MTAPDSENYQVFRDCVSSAIVAKFSPTPRTKKTRRPRTTPRQKTSSRADPKPEAEQFQQNEFTRTDPEDLADFIDFIATETFPSLQPPSLQTLTYDPNTDFTSDKEYSPQHLAERTSHTLPASITDTLTAYAVIESASDIPYFLAPILGEYVASVTKPPPVWATTRTDACEICERDWIPLSYHHLIPRSVHAKVVKKGWHEEWRLNSVAWLCRACHSFVHRMASNEELAREWFTVERICEREDVMDWARWVGRVRWKAR